MVHTNPTMWYARVHRAILDVEHGGTGVTELPYGAAMVLQGDPTAAGLDLVGVTLSGASGVSVSQTGSTITIAGSGGGGVTSITAEAGLQTNTTTGAVVLYSLINPGNGLLGTKDRYSILQATPGAATFTTAGVPNSSSLQGTASNSTSLAGETVSLVSAATVNSVAGIKGIYNVQPDWSPSLSFTGKISTGVDSRNWICFSDVDPTLLDSIVGTGYALAGFRYSTSAGDGGWQCIVSDGTTNFVQDSAVPFGPSFDTFSVVIDADNQVIYYYISGKLVGTLLQVNTNVFPTSGKTMKAYVTSTTLQATAVTVATHSFGQSDKTSWTNF